MHCTPLNLTDYHYRYVGKYAIVCAWNVETMHQLTEKFSTEL